mmetsp:Transcript_38274/g.100225  ORF Transcript_38274/g.100225 Transcript_38274/m.100225 type:complete len:200 (-) Transcript_38274:351-950(-)
MLFGSSSRSSTSKRLPIDPQSSPTFRISSVNSVSSLVACRSSTRCAFPIRSSASACVRCAPCCACWIPCCIACSAERKASCRPREASSRLHRRVSRPLPLLSSVARIARSCDATSPTSPLNLPSSALICWVCAAAVASIWLRMVSSFFPTSRATSSATTSACLRAEARAEDVAPDEASTWACRLSRTSRCCTATWPSSR